MDTSAPGRLIARDRFGLSLFYFFGYAAVGLSLPFVPWYLQDRGITLGQIGILGALQAAAGAVSQMPFGSFSDATGRRRPLGVAAAALLGTAYLLYGATSSFLAFAGLFMLTGIGFFCSATIAAALVSDWTASAGTTAAGFGSTRIWGTIGFIAALAWGWADPAAVTSRWLPYALALLSWASAAGFFVVREPEAKAETSGGLLRTIPELLGERNLMLFLACYFLFRSCETGAAQYLSLYLKSLGGDQRIAALAFGVNAIAEIPFVLLVGPLSDRIGRRKPLLLAFFVLPVRLFFYSLIVRPVSALWIQLFHGTTFGVMVVTSVAFVADQSPGKLRGTGQGALSMVGAASMAFGPLLAGSVADRWSLSSLYVILAAVASLAAVLFLLLVREPRQPGEQAIWPARRLRG